MADLVSLVVFLSVYPLLPVQCRYCRISRPKYPLIFNQTFYGKSCISHTYCKLNPSKIFRLILPTGLRRSEAVSIQISELHIKERTIEIRNAKGHKERIISISEDMAFLLENYCRFIKSMVSVQDKWLFPAVNPAFHLSSGALGDRFNRFWNPWILSVRKIRFLRLYCRR